jgi:hypothetical protein
MNRRSALVLGGMWLGTLSLGCNSSGSGDGGAGQGPGGSETPSLVCRDDADCDDRVFCNGDEVCASGQCRRSALTRCSDGIECTVDLCDESARSCSSAAPDVDGDGHGDGSCHGRDGVPLGDDCDDEDELSFPGNTEICDDDDRDEDCDPATLGSRDVDRDGYVDELCCNKQTDGELECGEDCDDNKSGVHPEATEVCDFFDNDCDGKVDEGVSIDRYPDRDHDGHGDDQKKAEKTCPQSVGYSDSHDDCDDEDPEVFKGQFEICDEKDNNCDEDRLADEIEEQAPWFEDKDEDTFGDATSIPVWSCYRISGRTLSQNDCNDQDAKVNRNAAEVCDAKDNDCNGLADYRLSGVNDFEDDDADGDPDAACGGGDCNDRDAGASDGAEETCDHIDNDCDGFVDEETTQTIWYLDEDGDGWGVVVGSALASCDPLEGRSRHFGDCDDADTASHPGVIDLCDGVDNNCDGSVDEAAGAYCQLANAISTCQTGQCAVYTCQPGFANTDGNDDNGCEAIVDPESLITEITCVGSNDCNDENLCNGIETCLNGFCRSGTPVNCTSSSDTVEGDIVVETVAHIRALRGVRRITGTLTIRNSTLRNLVGLESLEFIGGSLSIVGNPFLERLSGSALSNLKTVGGFIQINSNASLVSADLPGLLAAGTLNIDDSASLTELSGFKSLQTIDRIHVGSTPLRKISAFSNLTRIVGERGRICSEGCSETPCRGGGLVLEVPELEDLSGLGQLKEVVGDVCLSGFGAEKLELPRLTRARGLILEAPYDRPTPSPILEISFPRLARLSELELVSYSGDFNQLAKLSLPVLKEITERVDVGLDLVDIDEFSLPALTKVGMLNVQVAANLSLSALKFPKLATAQGIYLAQEEERLDPLATIDLSSLTSIDEALYITLPIAPGGLKLGKLAVLGTADANKDKTPDNSGALTLCIGVTDEETGAIATQACDILGALSNKGFVGTVDTCQQCSQIPLPVDGVNPWAGTYYYGEDNIEVDCAGNISSEDYALSPCVGPTFGVIDTGGSFTATYVCDGTEYEAHGTLSTGDGLTFLFEEVRPVGDEGGWVGRLDNVVVESTTRSCAGVEIWTGSAWCDAENQECASGPGMPRTVRMERTTVDGRDVAPAVFEGMDSAMAGDVGGTFGVTLPDLYGSDSCVLVSPGFDAPIAQGTCSENTEFGQFVFNLDIQRTYPPVVAPPL